MMAFDKKTKSTLAVCISLISIFLYLFFLSRYIKDETAPISKVAILYVLAVIVGIAAHLSVENIQSRKKRVLFGLMIFGIQLGLALFVTTVWFRPRSDYLIAHQVWLTHLRILAGQHYYVGISTLLRAWVNHNDHGVSTKQLGE